MSKASVTSVIVLCAALAACSDSTTNRTLTAPDASPTRNEALAGVGFGVTADGPFDVFFTGEDASAQLAATQMAAAQGTTGGRASGHVALTAFPPFLPNLASERYSFVALGTDPTTFAAKGEFELMLSTVSGVEQKFHGDVICMSVVGNTARIAGQLQKVWINNVQRPITGATHVIWTVVDNGEGTPTTDTASPMFFNNAANALLHCTTGFTPVQITPDEGNVQVQP